MRMNLMWGRDDKHDDLELSTGQGWMDYTLMWGRDDEHDDFELGKGEVRMDEADVGKGR